MPHARPAHADDLLEITTRNRIARHIIEGFSLVFPTLTSFWRQIDGALADALALAGEIDRLRAELAQIRLDRANLAAAGRATIAAYLDGESRPLELCAGRTARSGLRPAAGGLMTNPRRMRRHGPENAPLRHAAHGRHERQRPAPRHHHRHPRPLPVALPLRTRPAHHRRPDLAHRLDLPRDPHRVVASPGRHRRRPRRGQPHGGTARPRHPGRTRLRHGRHRGCGRMAGRRHRSRPGARAAAPCPRHCHAVCSRCPGGRTAGAAPRSASNASWPPGPRSPPRSAWPDHGSCPPWWTCGAGGPASRSPAARPSPT